MADENTTTEEIATSENTAATEPQGKEETVDWKKQSRKWEDRAKQSLKEIDTLKEKAAKWDEYEEESKTELEKLNEQLAAVTKERDAFAKAEEQRVWREEVAKEMKVPASILRGDTREEIAAHAKEILDSGLSAYGNVQDKGEAQAPAVTKESIEKIPNQLERVKARAKHADLYR